MCFFCTAIPAVAVVGLSQKVRIDREKREAIEQGLPPKEWPLKVDPSTAVVIATGAAITGLMTWSTVLHTIS